MSVIAGTVVVNLREISSVTATAATTAQPAVTATLKVDPAVPVTPAELPGIGTTLPGEIAKNATRDEIGIDLAETMIETPVGREEEAMNDPGIGEKLGPDRGIENGEDRFFYFCFISAAQCFFIHEFLVNLVKFFFTHLNR
jgi:hypothetical protein